MSDSQLKEFVKQLQEYEFDGSSKVGTPKEITNVEMRSYQVLNIFY